MSAALPFEVQPAGASMYRTDPVVGYALRPDQRLTMTLKTGRPPRYHWTATTDAEGRRLTHGPRARRGGPELWVFGCSFTYGWSLDDERTYPWLLQRALPEVEVVNFGVAGYGTVQSLLQLEEQLKRGRKPKAALLFYLPFHDQRNTLSPRYRRANGYDWTAWGERLQPYVEWDGGRLALRRGPPTYEGSLPGLRHSALLSWLDERLMERREAAAVASDHRREVTQALVQRFASLARENGIRFLLAEAAPEGSPPRLESFCASRGIAYERVDVPSFDRWREEGLTNLPYDRHPGPKGQALFAGALLPALRPLLRPGPASQDRRPAGVRPPRQDR